MKVVDALAGRLRPALPAWVALVVIVGAAGIVLDRDAPAQPGPGEARLEVGEGGEAVVTRVSGEVESIGDDALLRPGDQVEMAAGTASLLFQHDVAMEIRAVRPVGLLDGDPAPSSLVVGDVPTLRSGDVLVVSGDQPARLEAEGTEFAVSGAAKVVAELGVLVASYEGGVDVDSAGQEREVPALRQLSVPALGRPPAQPRALSYDEADEWDRRHLREAIDFGDELEDYALGFASLPAVRARIAPDVRRLRTVVPGLADEDSAGQLLHVERRRPVGDLLVGAAIAEQAAAGGFDDRWDEIFEFRDLGAHWGLVALDQQVNTMPLLDLIADAIANSPLGFDGGGDGELAAPAPGDGNGNGNGGPGTGGPGTGNGDGTDPGSGDGPTDPGDAPIIVDDPESPDPTDGTTGTTSPPGTLPPVTTPPTTPPPTTDPPPTVTLPPPTTDPPTTVTLPPITPPPTTLPTIPLPTVPLPTIPDGDANDEDDGLVGEILDPVEDTTDELIGGLLG